MERNTVPKTLLATMTILVLMLGVVACGAPTPTPTPAATPTPVPPTTLIAEAVAAIGAGQIDAVTEEMADLVCDVASGTRPPLALEDFTEDRRIIVAVRGYCAFR